MVHRVFNSLRDGRIGSEAGGIYYFYREHRAAVSDSGNSHAVVPVGDDGACNGSAVPKIIGGIIVVENKNVSPPDPAPKFPGRGVDAPIPNGHNGVSPAYRDVP